MINHVHMAFEVNKVIKGLVAYYMAATKEITKCACIWFAAVSWRLWQPQHLTSRGGNISPMTTGRRLQVFMTILCDICTPSVCLQICCVQDCVQLLPLPHRIPPLLKSPISTMLQRLIHSCVGSMVIMSWAETQLSMKKSDVGRLGLRVETRVSCISS